MNIRNLELTCLRILLLHVRGPTSFQDLRTFDHVTYPTFEQAARRRGLIEDDNEWIECLREASLREMPAQLRLLFVNIMVNCGCSDNENIWRQFADRMSEDFVRQWPNIDLERAHGFALHEINRNLQRNSELQ